MRETKRVNLVMATCPAHCNKMCTLRCPAQKKRVDFSWSEQLRWPAATRFAPRVKLRTRHKRTGLLREAIAFCTCLPYESLPLHGKASCRNTRCCFHSKLWNTLCLICCRGSPKLEQALWGQQSSSPHPQLSGPTKSAEQQDPPAAGLTGGKAQEQF